MTSSADASTTGPRILASASTPFYIPIYFATALMAALDFSLSLLSFVLGDLAFHRVFTKGTSLPEDAALLGAIAGLITVPGIFVTRGYSALQGVYRSRYALKFVLPWAFAFFVIGWIAFLTQTTQAASRGTVTSAFIIGFLLALPTRSAALAYFKHQVSRSALATRRAILMVEETHSDVSQIVTSLKRSGIDIRAQLPFDGSGDENDILSNVKDVVDRCRSILAHENCEAIYLFIPWSDNNKYRLIRSALSKVPVQVYLFPDRHIDEILRGACIETAWGAGYQVQRTPLSLIDRALKRVLDVAAASTALLLLSPLMAAVAVLIKLDSTGPVIFKQNRRGFSGRQFKILKFRSMTVCENGDTVQQARRGDLRITRVGAFIRKTSIDELPQLWNVVRGEMSLVGPRPHALAHDDFYSQLIASYASRHHVKPGLTGWAQVNGLRGETPEVSDMEARVTKDLWYIDNWSILLDLRIILRTVFCVLSDKRAY
ncbi:undecaprenyl-phosphate glucose phosphotransferase [Microvirga vignae]|nr:undecaprenyl-phosphate glucose phosphotransferase [Microvirga vignae]